MLINPLSTGVVYSRLEGKKTNKQRMLHFLQSKTNIDINSCKFTLILINFITSVNSH